VCVCVCVRVYCRGRGRGEGVLLVLNVYTHIHTYTKQEYCTDLHQILTAPLSPPPRLSRTHLEVTFLHKHLLCVLVSALRTLIDDPQLSANRLKNELKLSEG
jgi:hypothetical protein